MRECNFKMSCILYGQVILVIICGSRCLPSLFYLFIEKNWSALCERINGVIFLFGNRTVHRTDIFISIPQGEVNMVQIVVFRMIINLNWFILDITRPSVFFIGFSKMTLLRLERISVLGASLWLINVWSWGHNVQLSHEYRSALTYEFIYLYIHWISFCIKRSTGLRFIQSAIRRSRALFFSWNCSRSIESRRWVSKLSKMTPFQFHSESLSFGDRLWVHTVPKRASWFKFIVSFYLLHVLWWGNLPFFRRSTLLAIWCVKHIWVSPIRWLWTFKSVG